MVIKGKWDDVDRGLLKRRALDLAKPIIREDLQAKYISLLEFSLMDTRYAVHLDRVGAVAKIGEIVSVPLTPKHISGIVRRRGQSIALVNLRHFFHADAEGLADADFAVVVDISGKRFALQVEDIEGVIQLPDDSLVAAPENFDPAQLPFVTGITIDGLVVLDLEKLVAAKGFGTDRSRKGDPGVL
jgi:purine-binding chemotaxis protein CheW